VASAKTCPHELSEHVTLSGTKVREKLTAGERPRKEFSRPEAADVLICSMRNAPSLCLHQTPTLRIFLRAL